MLFGGQVQNQDGEFEELEGLAGADGEVEVGDGLGEGVAVAGGALVPVGSATGVVVGVTTLVAVALMAAVGVIAMYRRELRPRMYRGRCPSCACGKEHLLRIVY